MDISQILKNFDQKLFVELLKAERLENIIYSPFCIQTCLTMARIGAKAQTAIEMDKLLNLATWNLTETELATNYRTILQDLNAYCDNLTIANRIYISNEHELQETFQNVLTEQFFATIQSIDFNNRQQAVQTINNWVEFKTKNRVKNVVSPLMFDKTPPHNTNMVLISAIHFKANWQYPFPEYNTKEQMFYVNKRSKVKVQMMYRPAINDHFRYGKFFDLKAAALEMPYKNSDLSMIIILPDKPFGLNELEKQFKTLSIQDLKKRMNLSKVKISLPKFKAEYEMELSDVLKRMGMKRMFTNSADFNKIVQLKLFERVEISGVYHKACFDVNERGNETAKDDARLDVVADSLVPEFNVNHPFYFVIQNTKGIILFKGQVRKFTNFLTAEMSKFN